MSEPTDKELEMIDARAYFQKEGPEFAFIRIRRALYNAGKEAGRREAEAEILKLRALTWMAWKEFNAIRARSGAPLTLDGMTTVDYGYWSAMTDVLAKAAGSTLPWPTEEMKPVIDAIHAPPSEGEK